MGGSLKGADFSASLAQVSHTNNTISVTEKPTSSRYTAYAVLSLDVAAILNILLRAYQHSRSPADLQIANSTQEIGLSLHNKDFIIQEGNHYASFSANLSINSPANVSTTMEQIDKIFTADVTHAALTFSYSSVGTLAYLSLAKEDGSVIYYADMNEPHLYPAPILLLTAPPSRLIPEPTVTTLSILSLSLLYLRRRRV